MNAAIIKVTPDTGGVSVSLWLGAAGLSLCGVFMVQYFSIRAFPMANKQLRDLVSNSAHRERKYVSRKVLAMAISGPPLMTLWASTLFVVGIMIYIWEAKFDRTRYRVFAILPILGGVLIALISLILGESIGSKMYSEVRLSSSVTHV
jgi:FtsH-binding integral membrane protein